MTTRVIDRAIQIYGGAGVSGDTVLAQAYIAARTIKIADGPSEVHLQSIAHNEIPKYHPKL